MKIRNIMKVFAGSAALTMTGSTVGATIAADVFLFEDTNELNFDFQAMGDGNNVGFFSDPPGVPSVTVNVFTTTIAEGFAGSTDTGIDLTITATANGLPANVVSGFGGAIGVDDEGIGPDELLVFSFDSPIQIMGSRVFFGPPNTLTFTSGGGEVRSITANDLSTDLFSTPISLAANETLTLSVSETTSVFVNDLLVVVPEPASALLVGAGALLLCSRRRRLDS